MIRLALFAFTALLLSSSMYCQELARIRSNDNWGYMDRTGTQIIAPQFVKCRDFQNGLAAVLKNDKWGYVNQSGTQVIEPQFAKCKDFNDGLAAVFQNDKWGYIDTSGNWVIEPAYENVKDFNSGVALVLSDEVWYYIDKSGAKLAVPAADKYYDFADGIALIKTLGKVGLIDVNGKQIVEPKHDIIKDFVNGHARFKLYDKWGLMDQTGQVVIQPEYDKISDYHKHGISAEQGETKGVIVDGKFVPVHGAIKIWPFGNNSERTYAKKGKMIGFINGAGEWVITPQFYKVRSFSQGMAPVYNGDDWGYIDESGKVVINYQFTDAEIYGDTDLAPVKIKKLWGFVNKQGELVIPAMYQISVGATLNFTSLLAKKGFHDGSARVKKGKEWGYIDRDGNPIGGQWYQNAEVFSE